MWDLKSAREDYNRTVTYKKEMQLCSTTNMQKN